MSAFEWITAALAGLCLGIAFAGFDVPPTGDA